VEEEQRGSGLALPWVDLAAFAERAIDLASEDRGRMVVEAGWVFFHRGLVDAAVALEHATGSSARDLLASYERYHQSVFLTPPWPEIYVRDEQRQHNLAEAIAEYDRLLIAYRELGYNTFILPKVGVGERADFVLRNLR
jgi:predicted ATPase